MNRDEITRELESLDRRINNKKDARDSASEEESKKILNDEIKSLEQERITLSSRLKKLGGIIGGKMVDGVRVFTKRKRL